MIKYTPPSGILE